MHAFTGGSSDGANPWGTLIIDSSGNLYGTTLYGGMSNDGTVFELLNSAGTYTYQSLNSFKGGTTDGANPYGRLARDGSGNLYGTTANGGASGKGTVFEYTP